MYDSFDRYLIIVPFLSRLCQIFLFWILFFFFVIENSGTLPLVKNLTTWFHTFFRGLKPFMGSLIIALIEEVFCDYGFYLGEGEQFITLRK